MIYSTKEFMERYADIHQGLGKAIQFLQLNKLEQLEKGRYDIDGDSVYALVQEYETKEASLTTPAAKYEAHRKYIDVQYMVAGTETMGFAPIQTLQTVDSYDTDKDFEMLSGEGCAVVVSSGEFCIFFPEDAHMPGLCYNTKTNVKKVVVKVRI